jgi:hypothetical protein
MLACLVLIVVSYTQRPSCFKSIIKSIFKTNLPSLTSAPLILFADSFALSFLKFTNLEKMRAKMKYIYKKFINHQIKECLLFRCRHAVVIMQTLNWTNQCPLFMTVRHIFEISEDDHPWLVTHARDNWWTLDFANAFVSPGVNSRGELVPSHGASRRRLGDKNVVVEWKISWKRLECRMVSVIVSRVPATNYVVV